MVAGKSKQDTDFSFHSATKVAVAQICRSSGFLRCQPSALDALTRISSLYLLSLSRSASSSASLSGRTHSNLLDFLSALHDLSSPFGFPGASLPPLRRCLLKSPALTDLRSFLRARPPPPFVHPIRPTDPPPHPHPVQISPGKRVEIPPWLPPFPALGVANEPPKRSELYWEDVRDQFPPQSQSQSQSQSHSEVLKRVNKRRKMLPLGRDRVKFRVWGKDKSKTTKLMLAFSSQEVHCNYHQD